MIAPQLLSHSCYFASAALVLPAVRVTPEASGNCFASPGFQTRRQPLDEHTWRRRTIDFAAYGSFTIWVLIISPIPMVTGFITSVQRHFYMCCAYIFLGYSHMFRFQKPRCITLEKTFCLSVLLLFYRFSLFYFISFPLIRGERQLTALKHVKLKIWVTYCTQSLHVASRTPRPIRHYHPPTQNV